MKVNQSNKIQITVKYYSKACMKYQNANQTQIKAHSESITILVIVLGFRNKKYKSPDS